MREREKESVRIEGEGERVGEGEVVGEMPVVCQLRFNNEVMPEQPIQVLFRACTPPHFASPSSTSAPPPSDSASTACSAAIGAGIWLQNTLEGQHQVSLRAVTAAVERNSCDLVVGA